MGAAEESGKVLAGAKLYDALYASGGYPMRNTTRAAELLGAIQGLKTGHSISSVLDVGCSWGVAVNYLWGMGFKAAGVDISTIAISRAREVFGQDDVKCNGGPCFTRSSATKLPMADHSFDAIVSSDVLEHIEPVDVDTAVAELARIASKLILLKIPRQADPIDGKQVHRLGGLQNKSADAAGHSEYDGKLPKNLHATMKSPTWWIDRFKATGHGWRLLKSIPFPKGRPWLCCSFVLTREPAAGP